VEYVGHKVFVASTVFWPTQQENKQLWHCSSQQERHATHSGPKGLATEER